MSSFSPLAAICLRRTFVTLPREDEAEDSAKIRYPCVFTMSSERRDAEGPWNEFISLCHGPGKRALSQTMDILGNAVAFPVGEGNHTY